MKQSFACLLAALMVFSLAACGTGQNTGDQPAPDQNTTGDAITGDTNNGGTNNGAANNGTANNGTTTGNGAVTDGIMPGDNNTTNGTDNDTLFDDNGTANSQRGRAALSSSTLPGSSYEQMLRNARVHDTDGDLSDLENSYTPGSLGW